MIINCQEHYDKVVAYAKSIGDTKPIKETLKKLGGRFNCFLTCGAGWVFTKQNNKLEEVMQTLSIA